MALTTIARIVLAGLLVAIAVLLATVGGDAVPLWIVGVSTTLDLSPEVGARITAGACTAIAGILVFLRDRGRIPAMVVAAAIAFSGIADGSAVLALGDDARGGLLRPILQVLVGLPILLALSRTSPAPRKPMRHPGLAGVGIVGSIVTGAAVAANITIVMPDSYREAGASNARDASGRLVVNDLTASDWTGLTLEETGLLDHLPAIGPLTKGQTTLISFYRPNCGLCHDLFDKHFGDRLPMRTIAIRVPPAEGVELVESDYPEEVVCPDCVRLPLPEGPVWLVTTPVVIEVVDGRIACVSQDDFERCIDDAIARSASENQPAPNG